MCSKVLEWNILILFVLITFTVLMFFFKSVVLFCTVGEAAVCGEAKP